MRNLLTFGPLILFDAEGGAGGGGEHPAAPWSSAEGVWQTGAEGEQGDWWNGIQDTDVREHLAAKQYANPAELARANHSLTKMHTGDPNMISLPKDDASPEDLNAFYNKLGRPAEAKDYKFDFAEGTETNDGMVEFGKTMAYDLGLNPKQAQAMADKWGAYVTQENQAQLDRMETENSADVDALKTKWGADLDKNLAAGKRVVESLGLDPSIIDAVDGNIGSAAVIEMLAAIGLKSGEAGFTGGDGGGDVNDPASMSPERAQARIDELQGDAAFQARYSNPDMAVRKTAMDELEKLYKRLG